MKKLHTFIAMICLFMTCCGFCCGADAPAASEETYYFEEIGMTVTIPKNESVYTIFRNIEDGDAALSFAGYASAEEAIGVLKENGLFLDSYDESTKTEIVIQIGTDIGDYEANGVTCVNQERYETDQADYEMAELRIESSGRSILWFNTAVDSSSVDIIFNKFGAEMTEKDYISAKAVIDSIAFGANNVQPDDSESKPEDLSEEEADDAFETFCTNCGADLESQEGFDAENDVWFCTECGTLLVGSNVYSGERYPDIYWFCDSCDACLSCQEGFSDLNDVWVCTACGYENQITLEEAGGIFYENVQLRLFNETDFTMSEIYSTNSLDEYWGDNLLEELDDPCLKPGEYLNLTFDYYENFPLFDFVAVDQADGTYIEFYEIDVSGATESMDIVFSGQGDSFKISLENKK